MEIKKRAILLRGHLEMLSAGDTITKKQIQILLSQMEELVSSLEDYEEEDYEVQDNKSNQSQPSISSPNVDDDLPF